MGKLLVIGARPGSIGMAVVVHAAMTGHWSDVVTAGVTKGHDIHLDVTDVNTYDVTHKFDDVVCTVGVNQPSVIGSPGFGRSLVQQMNVNALGVMCMMEDWCSNLQDAVKRDTLERDTLEHHTMSVVSSNSAHVARSQSVGYCMSKAALSMGVRCMARQMADYPITLFGVEPGWVHDTPMSNDIATLLSNHSPHRIPGGRALSRADIAAYITALMVGPKLGLNGCMLRIDGGDQ